MWSGPFRKGLFVMQIFTAAFWEKGVKTSKNQDSLALCQMIIRRKRCLMAAVCDGIGSIPDSEIASGFVTEQLVNWFYRDGPRLFAGPCGFRKVENTVKRELYRIRQQFEKYEGKQGCTLSMLLIIDRKYFLWHAGDSRIYRGRGKKVKQMTADDVYQGMLTNCIGTFPWKGVITQRGYLKKKDTFLVCSDGFYKRITKEEMDAVLLGEDACGERKAKRVLKEAAARARMRGEKDDLSALYVRCAKAK